MRYAFYPGCAYDGAAGYAESVNAVCDRLGITLAEIPELTQCMLNAGYTEDAIRSILGGNYMRIAAELWG